MKSIPMNWKKPKPLSRRAPLVRVASVAAAAMLLAAGCSNADAASGNTTAASGNTTSASATGPTIHLNPGSGSTSGMPTWSTSAACPAGLQGSAIFRAVSSSGQKYDISQALDGANHPLSGTLQANIATIRSFGGVHDGATQELLILCFSGQALTGKFALEEHEYITYSANGKSYATSATRP
ncbi:MAG TPA: hypothetical protein VN969_47415 [Streptosporangiaceae bacterium]|jgi:hypothetical protein|nr:hypothetical protein [Streptosporangiaceae bacterium]